MSKNDKGMVLVAVQLGGGNDVLNTVIPYTDPLYKDNRPKVGIPLDQVIPIDDHFGFHPSMGSLKELYDQGKMAIINGIGYPNPSRSHFRSMDIWHTCEPEKVGTEGWLGRAIRDLDPKSENVLTGVNMGRGLPRAMAAPGVPVASVGNLESYGVLTGISGEQQRAQALDVFSRLYGPAIGRDMVMEYLCQTGLDALKGADIIKVAPERYSSTVEYGSDPLGQYMRSIAQVHLADLGARIFCTAAPYNVFDTHGSQLGVHSMLLEQTSRAVTDLYEDIKEHNASENVVIFVFTEFGRRVLDNGTGTDHGSGGSAFVIGDRVKGGMYGEYPSMAAKKLLEGDLHFNNDFRSTYSTLLEKGLGLDPKPIVNGVFEQFDFL